METKTLEEKLLDAWIIDDIVRDDNGNITHIYLRDEGYGIVACIIYPHEGNGNQFMLRAEFINAFDRWDNISCEVFFEKEYEAAIDPDEVFELLKIDDFAYDDEDDDELYLMSEIEDDYIG